MITDTLNMKNTVHLNLPLNHSNSDDTMTIAYLNEQIEQLKRKDILKQYHYWYNEKKDSWLWNQPDLTARGGRRQIKRRKKEDIEQCIIEYHLAHYGPESKSSPTVSDIFDDYYEATKKDKSILISTLNRYRNYFNKYIAINKISDLEIVNVSEKDIRLLLDSIVKGKTGENRITKKVFNEVKGIINNIFSFAKTEMDIECIGTKSYMLDLKYNKRHFKIPKKSDEESVYSEQEFIMIKDYIISRYKRGEVSVRELGILFCFLTGLRAGELSCLMTSDLVGNVLHISRHLTRDENSRYTIIDGVKEGEEAKEVILSDNALTVWKFLQKVNLKNGNPTSYVFYDDRQPTHKNLVTHHFDTTLRHICKELKIPFRSPHKMRATYISSKIDNGANPTDIQRNVGHKELSTTLNNYKYRTKSQEQLKNALNQTETFDISIAV